MVRFSDKSMSRNLLLSLVLVKPIMASISTELGIYVAEWNRKGSPHLWSWFQTMKR